MKTAGAKDRLRQHMLLLCAIDLVKWAREHRIEHIHGHSCADSAHILALARRAGGPPFSLTLHGDLDVYGMDHKLKMAEAAFICTVGNHLRQEVLERASVAGDRVLVTCMGVDTSRLKPLGRERSYHTGSLNLVTVARLEPTKGHLYAIAAIRRAIDLGLNIRYTIAGEGSFRDAIVRRIRELGLGGNISLTGTLAENEVFDLLSQADAFVLPSIGLGEAWPVSVMEAMGAGLPVIASVIGATPQMITSAVDGFLVPQKDEEALLQRITLLARDIKTRQRIGQAARLTAARCFDVVTTATKLRDAIHASRNSMV
jgi:colanic acid/amylovoran biosynthesis glycosyltransferase